MVVAADDVDVVAVDVVVLVVGSSVVVVVVVVVVTCALVDVDMPSMSGVVMFVTLAPNRFSSSSLIVVCKPIYVYAMLLHVGTFVSRDGSTRSHTLKYRYRMPTSEFWIIFSSTTGSSALSTLSCNVNPLSSNVSSERKQAGVAERHVTNSTTVIYFMSSHEHSCTRAQLQQLPGVCLLRRPAAATMLAKTQRSLSDRDVA